MNKAPKYYIVAASALPEIFLSVAEAKRLLNTGEAHTVHEATKIVGISRSAFYKYRDVIMPFDKNAMGHVITFQFRLQDEPGVLSAILHKFADQEANILTVNSIVPNNGCALVTITAETSDIEIGLDELMFEFSNIPGVIKADALSG